MDKSGVVFEFMGQFREAVIREQVLVEHYWPKIWVLPDIVGQDSDALIVEADIGEVNDPNIIIRDYFKCRLNKLGRFVFHIEHLKIFLVIFDET